MSRSQTKVKAENFSDYMRNLFDEYGEEVIEASKETVEEVGKETVKILRNKAESAGFHLGENGAKYAKSFKSKKTAENARSKTVTIYSTQYRLAHLLENGHTVISHGKVCGRAKAFKHWEPAEEEAEKLFEEKIKLKVEG